MKKGFEYKRARVVDILARAWLDQDFYFVDLLVKSTCRDSLRATIRAMFLQEPWTPVQATFIVERTQKEEVIKNPGTFSKAVY